MFPVSGQDFKTPLLPGSVHTPFVAFTTDEKMPDGPLLKSTLKFN